MMDEVIEKAARRTIAATPDNAADLRAFIRRWPDLHALVQDLQADGLFPGLRGVQIRLVGAPEWVAQGLAAPLPENATAGATSRREGHHAR